MNGSPYIAKLQGRIDVMQEAVQPLLTGNLARAARWGDWNYYLLYAAWRERGNKRTFYRLRIVALVSGITVPSLVGLNLAGTGGVVVRWLTFGLSLVAAIATGIIALYRTGDRWLMYRRLMDSLTGIGYALVDNYSADPLQGETAWKEFAKATDQVLTQFNRTYEAAVIQVAQSGSSQPGPGGEDGKIDSTGHVAHP